MIQKSHLAVAILALLLLVSAGQAQFLGQLSTAQSPGPGKSTLGGFFGIHEDAFSFSGQYRYGLANYLDGAIKLGFINIDVPGPANDEAGILVGGDLKYQLLDAALGDPLDLGIGGKVEFLGADNFTIFSLGGILVGSYPFEMRNGRHISPYASINLRMQRVDSGGSNTDFEFGLGLGTQLELTQEWNLIGEFMLEDNLGFLFGVNYDL